MPRPSHWTEHRSWSFEREWELSIPEASTTWHWNPRTHNSTLTRAAFEQFAAMCDALSKM